MNSFDDLYIILWIIIIVIYSICAVLFFILWQKAKEEDQRRRIMFLISFLFLFLGLSRVFDLLAYLNKSEPLLSSFLWSINQLFLISGLIVIIFSFEKKNSARLY